MGIVINCPERYQDKTIENYSGRKKQIDQLLAWSVSRSHDSNSILFTGPTGTGKTHLAIAAAKLIHDVDTENPISEWIYDSAHSDGGYWRRTLKRQARTIFKNCVSLMFEINSGIDDGSGMMSKIEPIISDEYDAVILDDFGINKMTDHTRQVLYMIIDSRYSRELSTIITTNLTLSEIHQIDQRISSRMFEMCSLIIKLEGKDWRTQNGRCN